MIRVCKLFYTTLVIVILSLSYGCGIEVGNPNEPTPVPTKVEADREAILNLISAAHDEALQSATETYSFPAANVLALLDRGGSARKGNCSESQDGSLRLALNESFTETRKAGPVTRRLSIEETANASLQASVRSEGSSLRCKKSKTSGKPDNDDDDGEEDEDGPELDWAQQIQTVSIASEISRKRQRSFALEGTTNQPTKTEALTLDGTRQITLKRLVASGSSFSVQRTVLLNVSATTDTTQASSSASVQSKVSTLDKEPLVIEESLNSKGQRTALSLRSGAIVSERKDGAKILLRFDSLSLQAQGQCQAVSGSLEGLLSDGQGASETFSVLFSSEGASVRFSDGTVSELIVESCRLNPNQP